MSKSIFIAIRIPTFILQTMGVWPKEFPTVYDRTRKMMSIFIGIMFVITMTMELFQQLHDYDILTAHLSLMIQPTSFIIKAIILIRKSKRFISLYNKLSSDIFNNYPKHLEEIMKKSTKTAAIVGNTYQCICYFVCLCICLMPLFGKGDLPLRFSYDLGPYKIFMYIFQVLGMFNAVFNNACLDVLAMALIGIAAAEIGIFNKTVVGFKDHNSPGIKTSRFISHLSHCVKHHNEIIRYVEDLEEVFSFIFLVQYLTSIAVICIIGFQLVHINPVSLQFSVMAFYFIALMWQLGMYCWYGNEVIVKSSATKDACYESDWSDCDVRVRKMLIIITERSKRPLFLTAGKFSVLSLTSFTTVINTSYSYFALMQRLYNKHKH